MRQPPSAQSVLRKLKSLQEDYSSFQADGARLPRAKVFINVIHPAIQQISLEWLCICNPALHLDLEIYAWMFEAFLADMRELDTALAAELDQQGTHLFGGSSGFADVVELNRETKQKSLEKEQLQSRINLTCSQVSN